MNHNQQKVLITGASGFIGGWLVKKALECGFQVYAGLRASSNKVNLQDPRIKFFEVDFAKPYQLQESLKEFQEKNGSFDFVIHNAGVTRANKSDDFYKGNFDFLKIFASALKESHPGFKKFIFISSMAAAGPGDEKSFEKIFVDSLPQPLTPYGKSKLLAEQHLQKDSGLPYLIFRPAVVFGPQNRSRFWMFKMINSGFELSVSFDRQQMAFLYIEDLANIVIRSLSSNAVNKTYFISDGEPCSLNQFQKVIKEVLAAKTFSIPAPKAIFDLVDFWDSQVGKIIPKLSLVPPKVMKEITALNWNLDIDPIKKDLDFRPAPLAEAVRKTVEWYKKEGWM